MYVGAFKKGKWDMFVLVQSDARETATTAVVYYGGCSIQVGMEDVRCIDGSSMWGEGLEKVEELQREQEGRDSFLGTAHSSVDQQHRATFYASKHARSRGYEPTILMGSGFLVDASQGVPKERSSCCFSG